MIATGILDYSLAPDQDDEDQTPANEDESIEVSKTAN